MIRTLIVATLITASGAASAGLDSSNGEALRLHKRTVRSVQVVTAIEGQPSVVTSAFGSTMRGWVEEGLRQNAFVIDPDAKSAPDLRFGGYCGKAVGGCTLKLHVARDLWYAHPDGAVFKLPARDVAEEKVTKEGASYSEEEMYPLFVRMLTKFVETTDRFNPVAAVPKD